MSAPSSYLPAPASGRFSAHRGGLISLFQYDEQQFEFADRGLLLRGENGAGKSTALQLIFPLCLDGDIAPHNLDTVGEGGRTIRQALLVAADAAETDSAIGYAWLEFARRDDAGCEHYLSSVLGFAAKRNTARTPDRWFGTLTARRDPDGTEHGLRLGKQFKLVEGDYTVPRKRFREQLAEHPEWASVPENAQELRDVLAAQLFGMPVERYEQLLTTLRWLRASKLGVKFEARLLQEAITAALPELDRAAIDQFSGQLSALDALDRELTERRTAYTAVAAFAEAGAAYASARCHAHASELIGADRGAGAQQRTQTELAGQLAEARQLVDDQTETLALRRRDLEASEAAVEMLEGSTEAQDARALAGLREQADTAEGRVADGRENVQQLGKRAANAAAAAEEARTRTAAAESELTSSRDQVAAHAERAGIGSIDDISPSPGDPPHRERQLSAAITARQEECSAQRSRNQAAAEARRSADAAELRAADAEERERDAHQTIRARRETLDGIVDARRGEIVAAVQALSELTEVIAPQTLISQLVEAVETHRRDVAADALLAPAVAAADRRRGQISREHGELDVREADLERQRADVAARIEDLVHKPQPHISPPPWRDERPSELAGAPLWRCVDFRSDLDADAQSGIESALLAAGLLDAWLTPNGELVADGRADAFLDADAPSAHGRTLAEALVAEGDAPVDAAVIARVLSSVAWPTSPDVDQRTTSGDLRLGSDGQFAFGPLLARARPQPPALIGARARERARERQLAELRSELAQIDEDVERIAARRRGLDAATERVDHELLSLPQSGPVVQAHAQLDAAENEHELLRGAAERERREAQGEAAAATAAEEQADQHALRHRLPGPHHADRLAEIEKACVDMRLAARSLRSHEERAAETSSEAQRAAGSLDEIEGDKRAAQVELEERERLLAAAQARRDAKAQSVGAAAHQIEAELTALRATRQSLKTTIDTLNNEMGDARDQVARYEVRLDQASTALDGAQELVAKASERFRLCGRQRLLELALGDQAPLADLDADTWDDPQTVDVALQVRQLLSAPRESEDEIENRLSGAVGRLSQAVRDIHDYQPSTDSTGGLRRVRVREGDQYIDVLDALAHLREDIERRQEVFDDREHTVFERFLYDGLGSALGDAVSTANALVDTMNDVLASCPTNFDLRLRLDWRPVEQTDDSLGRVDDAVKLLQRDLRHDLTDDDQEQLIAFLRRQVQLAKERALHDGDGGDVADQLRRGLDYRAWHRTRARLIEADDHEIDLTSEAHQRLSGGEKAMMLHLPAFAAVAAHLQEASASSSAPRIIALDEAFAGLDEEHQARLFALMRTLDFDYVLTSERLNPCFPEASGCGIYHLYRDGNEPGIYTAHTIWDGATEHVVPDDEPPDEGLFGPVDDDQL